MELLLSSMNCWRLKQCGVTEVKDERASWDRLALEHSTQMGRDGR